MKEGFLNIKCSTIKNMVHNCTAEEFVQVLDMAVDYVSDGVDHRADAPKGIIRMMLYSVTDDIDFYKKEKKREYDAERYQRQKAEKDENANSTNFTNSTFSTNSENSHEVHTLNQIESNKIELNQNETLFVCSAGAREETETNKQTPTTLEEWMKRNLAPLKKEVAAFFKEQGELDESEPQRFYDYNESLGWKCLPNWQRAAIAWINRIDDR